MKQHTERGYQIVDPGLCLPELALDGEAQVRCLSYLMRRIRQIMLIPDGVCFELIPCQYLGGPYPVIGLYTHKFVDTDENLTLLSFTIEERLEQLTKEMGIEWLLLISAEEDVCWDEILEPYREALLQCQDDWRR